MKKLLWIDALAAMTSGIAVWILKGFLTGFTGLPLALLTTLACVSLAYSAYSFSLACWKPGSKILLDILVAANLAYALACLVILVFIHGRANAWGMAYLLAESSVVAALAGWERKRIRTAFGGG